MKLTKLESEITYLLNELSTELGFCLPLDEKVKIASNKAINAEHFTKEVLIAEGMNPEYEKKWFSQIKSKFIEKFGDQVSENDYPE